MQAYFKLEQEAAVQQHKSRLVKEGKLDDIKTHDDDDAPNDILAAEVLAEILQAQARVDDPNAARKREYLHHRTKAEPPPLSPEELRRFRQSTSTAAIGHIPRLSLSGRNRYGIADIATSNSLTHRTPTSQEVEIASRSYIATMRALSYGSLLGIALIAVGGTSAFQLLGAGTIAAAEQGSFKDSVRDAIKPLGIAVKSWVLPLKESMDRWVNASQQGHVETAGIGRSNVTIHHGGSKGANHHGHNSDEKSSMAEFQTRLKNRFKGGGGGGGGGG